MGKVGEVLRQKRESRSLSLDDVRSALGIPLHYLQAMENGSSGLVADEFYLIPFLRRYAEYLELDQATTVAQFLGEAAREEARATSGGLRPAGVASRGNRASRGAWMIGGLVALALVATAVWLLLAT